MHRGRFFFEIQAIEQVSLTKFIINQLVEANVLSYSFTLIVCGLDLSLHIKVM